MTTKHIDGFLLSKNKDQLFTNSSNQHDPQYGNLNLNQNHKTSSSSTDAFLNSSQSKSSNNNRLFTTTACCSPYKKIRKDPQDSFFSESYQNGEKVSQERNQSKNYSSSLKQYEPLNLFNQSTESNDPKQMKKYSNSSTLSLHIAAYENSIEAANEEDKLVSDAAKSLAKSSLKFQNPFELPRQNDNDDSSKKPEVMQYKASQKLNNLDTNDSTNNNTTNESTQSTTTSQESSPKKPSRWRQFLAKFRRKPKPSSETTIQTTQTTQATTHSSAPFEMQQESDAGGLCSKKKKKDGNDEVAVEANTSWRRLRRVKSLEGSGKTSKKIPKAKRPRQKNKTKRPSKESIGEPVVFDDQKTQEQHTQEQTIGDPSTKVSPQKQKDNETESRKISRKKVSSKEGDDLSISKSVQRGFRNFRDKRAKDFRTVKTFISQKYQKRAMEKVVAEVEARKQRRTTDPSQDSSAAATSTPTKLHHGDDIFPQRKPRKKSDRQVKQPDPNNNASPKFFTKHETSVDSNGLVLIETNNCNDGKLFLANGRPFWQQTGKGKPGEPDDDDELTDDELPMNAEVIIDVHNGKIKLTDMPTTTVVLDPYGPTMALEEHDNSFFTRDLIFSNTVRSMINLNDELADHLAHKSSAERRCHFETPHQIHRYVRSKPDEFKTEHFKPKNSERK